MFMNNKVGVDNYNVKYKVSLSFSPYIDRFVLTTYIVSTYVEHYNYFVENDYLR